MPAVRAGGDRHHPPKVIVALGGSAAEGLGIEGPVSRNRGRCHSLRDIPVVVTYHPSYLLRQEQEGYGIQAKRQWWTCCWRWRRRACRSARSSAAFSSRGNVWHHRERPFVPVNIRSGCGVGLR